LKSAQKTVQKLSKELATKVAEELNANPNPPDFFSLHRNDGVDIKVSKTIFFFITIADAIDSKSGSLIIQGNPEDITAVADEICGLLGGKGNGKNNRYQAKVSQLSKIKDCENLLKKHFENK
jgi:misacylated tRNA(Ala) deacylase